MAKIKTSAAKFVTIAPAAGANSTVVIAEALITVARRVAPQTIHNDNTTSFLAKGFKASQKDKFL